MWVGDMNSVCNIDSEIYDQSDGICDEILMVIDGWMFNLWYGMCLWDMIWVMRAMQKGHIL